MASTSLVEQYKNTHIVLSLPSSTVSIILINLDVFHHKRVIYGTYYISTIKLMKKNQLAVNFIIHEVYSVHANISVNFQCISISSLKWAVMFRLKSTLSLNNELHNKLKYSIVMKTK